MNPLEALTVVYRRTPTAARVAYAGLGFFAAAALVISWVSNVWTSFVVAIMVLVIGLVAAQVGRARSRILGDVLSWAIAVLTIGAAAVALFVVITGRPPAAATLLARMFKTPDFLTVRQDATAPYVTTGNVALSTLPEVFRRLDVKGDRYDRLRELRSLPSLRLQAAVLSMPFPAERRTLVASRLILDGSTIETNGGDLEIEVIDLDAQNNGRIVAFAHPDSLLSSAGGSGRDGKPGGTVTIRVHGRILGKLDVDLSGQDGGAGAAGDSGAAGSNGAQGERAASGLFDCQRGPGGGGPGLPGAPGQNGSSGGNGGDGGHLQLVGDVPVLVMRAVSFRSAGGRGGRGGEGGVGGRGGQGGPGGVGDGLCRGPGPTGSPGPDGPNGKAGKDGLPGADVSAPQGLTFLEAGL